MQLDKFISQIEAAGETFFSTGDKNADYEYVVGVLSQQGYWAGIRERLYFDQDFNLVRRVKRTPENSV